MKEFKEIQGEIVKLAIANNACYEGISDANNCTNEKELIEVIFKYISWLINTKTINVEWLESNFEKPFLYENGIYTSGSHQCKVSGAAWGNSTVEALGNSTVEAWGNSTVEALGNSTVEAWGNSTVKAWDNSTVEAWDNSTVEAWGNSTVEAWDNSTVEALGNSTVEAWDNSTVKAWDNSTVKALGNSTVEALGNSYCEFFNSRDKHTINDSAILKDYYNKTIYVIKDKFKIEEI